MTPGIRNILVIRFSSLGDVVLTTPVLANLRQALPEAKLSMLTKRQYQDIFFNNPNIDEILTLEKQENLASLINQVRKNKYDLIIDLHNNLRSQIVGFASGTKVIRYHKQSINRYALLHFKQSNPALQKTVVQRYLDTLDFLGAHPWHLDTKIYLTEKETRNAQALLEQSGSGTGDLLIGLNPGATWETKKWPLPNWLDFIKLCRGQKMKLLLFGDSSDQIFISALLKEAGDIRETVINMAGKTDLRQLSALIRQCRVLVTGDSGALHIAQALDVPVLALLGPTVPEFGFISARKNDIILFKELPCRPCSLHGTNDCKRGDRLCLAGLSAQEVFESLQEQLKADSS
ncbi:MAG: glycosyltransferase family 9 protein [bacterium]|nr:glycosyltransferase family 9 protein [bacterium]MDD5354329.1 glycosyltransferase family 9 protein [bacterium]MDD5756357.1 glycosyltransferase family 9 protein [bacterium]